MLSMIQTLDQHGCNTTNATCIRDALRCVQLWINAGSEQPDFDAVCEKREGVECIDVTVCVHAITPWDVGRVPVRDCLSVYAVNIP